MRNLFLYPLKQVYLIRGQQIAFAFALTVFIQEWFDYPYAAYTGFVLMMIYIGFDIGAVYSRGLERFWGTILGCICGFLYWDLGHLNDRMILLVIVLWVFGFIYSASHSYRTSTFFTMSLTLLGTGYLDQLGVQAATEIITDILLCTLFAYAIMVVLQTYAFKNEKLGLLILYHQQKNLIKHLRKCEKQLDNRTSRSVNWHLFYEDILNEIVELKNYIQFNQELLLKFVSQQSLHHLIEWLEDYYLALSLKVALKRKIITSSTLKEKPDLNQIYQKLLILSKEFKTYAKN